MATSAIVPVAPLSWPPYSCLIVSFSAACQDLPTTMRLLVVDQLTAWRGHESLAQVACNIEGETALPVAAFTSLLAAFGEQLAAGSDPAVAWLAACRKDCHRFCGSVLPAAVSPRVVGRALKIDQYANLIATEPQAGLTQDQAATLLRQFAGQPLPTRVLRILQKAPVGGRVVWAPFNATAPTTDPFNTLSHRTVDILTALGLGSFAASETLVLLAYRPLRDGMPEPLHRPTIAEAEVYAFFRPYPDAAYPYGYTAPLLDNPRGLAPQPEVVHRPILAEGLVVPFRISTPVGASHVD